MEYDRQPEQQAPSPEPELAVEASPAARLDPHLKKEITVNAASFLGREDECQSGSESEDEDEWERYVAMAQAPLGESVLTWWAKHESEFPNVAKMAKQVLGCPTCSSGVERLFSKAGRNHSKLQGSMKDASMRNIMFAYNVSRTSSTPPKQQTKK